MNVLTIVSQYPVAAFSQARTRSFHDFVTIEASRFVSNPDALAVSETVERNLFHRTAPQSVRQAGVMDDASVSDVNPVMAVEHSRCDEVRCKWRLLSWFQKRVAREAAFGTGVATACIVCPPVHDAQRYAALKSAAIARWCRPTRWCYVSGSSAGVEDLP
jgi:hypothetical protein